MNHQKLSKKCLLAFLMTVVQSMDESPRLSTFTDNRPQSPNTAVCLVGWDNPVLSSAKLHTAAHTPKYGGHRHCWWTFFFSVLF